MLKTRFKAGIKSIGLIVIALLLSFATISMLHNLDFVFLRFLVVLTLVKLIWHLLDKAKWYWGIYVDKKSKNMYINSLISQIYKNQTDIKLHFSLFPESEENVPNEEIDIEKSVFKAMDKFFKQQSKVNSSKDIIDIQERK